eukprot:s7355_g1.t1
MKTPVSLGRAKVTINGLTEDYAVNDISAWDACCECQRCPREVILMDQAELDSYAALGCQRAHRILSVRAGDFSQLKLRTVNYLGLESVTAQNLTGFDNTVVEQRPNSNFLWFLA